MTGLKAFITRRPVATYFALTFTISWGGVLLVIGGPARMTATMAQGDPLFPLAVLAMVAGPSVTGILLTGLVDGKPGLREFRSRLLSWRVGAGWYVVALLTAPLLATAITLTLSLYSPQFLPAILVTDEKAALLVLGVVVGLTATVLVLTPRTTGGPLLAYGLAFAAALWVVLAAVALANSRHLSRHRLPRAKWA
jgi:hypothetical protein